jgi:glycosyltransferase involved in cell wall biosynthesis
VIVASRNEGLARCMIESLACGTPVVSFDVCSAREILQGHDCGVVVSGGDYDAMVHEIVTLFEAGEVRAELGHRAAEAAKKLFNPPEIISRYEQLYLSLTKN